MLSGSGRLWTIGMDSNADFFGWERFVSFARYERARREPGSIPMTMVSRLSVVTAYVAFAFVGAIVIGVF
jgi:hypothetical protein